MYIVFCFDDYYPKGGMNDCKGVYECMLEAIKVGKCANKDNCHIYGTKEDKWYKLEIDLVDMTNGV